MTPMESAPSRWRTSQAALVGRFARTYARVLRGRIAQVEGIWVVTHLPRRCFPRGGVTFGDTYLTGDAPFMVSARRLAHERVHVEQWQRYGLGMAWRYLAAGRDPHRNRFEVEAGLEDGGYVTRAPGPLGPAATDGTGASGGSAVV